LTVQSLIDIIQKQVHIVLANAMKEQSFPFKDPLRESVAGVN